MTKKHKVLVVDDEKGVRKLLEAMLEKKGYEAFGAEDAEQALDILGRETFGLVITDLRLPGLSGEELLERLKQGFPNVPVVVISAFGKTKNIVDVIKRGAEDYLSKPFTLEDLEVVVLKALEKHKLLTENQRLRQEIAGGTGPLVGKSRAITKVLEMIEKFAASDAHVLITGESGVGKELAARAIHEMSACSDGPLIQVNAGALPHSLFEAELFGVKKGAYT
ncbi:MAG TPA: response regulator, partial [bacterium]|nr:response regulator [bacterium]